MIPVEGGSFLMGNDSLFEGNDAKPVHQVTLGRFRISKYEITVAQFRAYCKAKRRPMPKTPSWGWKEDHPIVNVSYPEAVLYCKWLSQETGQLYQLPTEAQWEYAARGGHLQQAAVYAGSSLMDSSGWYASNSNLQSHTVGTKLPNAIGVYDCSGNVWEWCSDWYAEDYYKNSPSNNPTGPVKGKYRVLRGGSWGSTPDRCRVDARMDGTPSHHHENFGFRVVSQ
jgi:formylglycine-generating enzyme required for sulfatase activity